MAPRTALAVLLGVATVGQVFAQRRGLDPEFAKVPFDEWMKGGNQAQIKWKIRIYPTRLSNHQRLLTQIQVALDGAELAKRRGQGRMIAFVQVSDEQGRRYQNHAIIELNKVEEGWKASDVTFDVPAFILPGEYRVAVAIYDTATSEHCARQEKLRVSPLKNDPLPDVWQDLRSVEFVRPVEPPDSWYLPSVRRRLRLPVEMRRPARIEVIVNMTPSELAAGSLRIRDQNMATLIPALKVIAQADFHNASVHVSLLDLSRQRVAFRQEDAHGLDWLGVKAALTEAAPGTIDVKSLGDRQRNAAFFVAEVSRRIAAATDGQPVVLIVLSSPVAFEPGADLQPIRIASKMDWRVFYFRFHEESARPPAATEETGRRRHSGMYSGPPGDEPTGQMSGRRHSSSAYPDGRGGSQIDQLEPTLKPLAPRLFDVKTPEQFRKALAVMLAEISSL